MDELTESEIPAELVELREALTPEQAAFADLILSGRNQTDAYREAYQCADNSAWTGGWRMLRIAEVSAYLHAVRELAARDTAMSLAEKRAFLAGVVRTSPAELIDEEGNVRPELAHFAQRIVIREDEDGSRTVAVEMPNKLKAVELDSKLAGPETPPHNPALESAFKKLGAMADADGGTLPDTTSLECIRGEV